MFSIKQEPFGDFTHVKLINTATGEFFSFIPEFGATINDLVLAKNGRLYKLIYSSKDYRDLLSEGKRMFKGSKLSPFPNRINNGKYIFDGKEYHLPINFPSEGHAIHGLVLECPFEIIDKKESKDKASVTAHFTYDGNTPGYPFSYILTITFSFTREGVKCKTIVENTYKESIPIGDGWHPYFTINTKVDRLHLQMPPAEILVVDKRMIPTGEVSASERFTKMKAISKHVFDSCYRLKETTNDISKIRLYHPERQITLVVWQETGEKKYNYLQLYTPQSRQCIAIEPMTCAPDAFNNYQGLIILKTGEKWQANFGIVTVQSS